VGEVVLGQVFPRVLRFSHVNFIPPVFHYLEKKTDYLHHKCCTLSCGASAALLLGPSPQKKKNIASEEQKNLTDSAVKKENR
jgi:hypothetical protein